jgi:hypothetical protein
MLQKDASVMQNSAGPEWQHAAVSEAPDVQWENARRAVALLTAWTTSDGDMTMLGAIVDSYASDATSVEEVVEILQGFVAGLVSLSGGLLMELSRMADQTPVELLAVIGRRMAEATEADEDEDDD